jgi:DNA-binding transcriptional ArsR family regulator
MQGVRLVTERDILAPDVAADVAGVFRALSDPTRVRLVSALTEEELSVGELAEALGMTLSAVSHQLGLLRSLRVVRGRRDGRHVYYSLDDEHVYELYRRALEHVSHADSAEGSGQNAGGCSDGNQR